MENTDFVRHSHEEAATRAIYLTAKLSLDCNVIVLSYKYHYNHVGKLAQNSSKHLRILGVDYQIVDIL